VPDIKIKYGILIAAIAISLAWHLLWLSVIRVVSAPSEAGSQKFSKVSFLGPVSVRGAIEARNTPTEITFLEERYIDGLRKVDLPKFGRSDRGTIPVSDSRDVERSLSLFIERSLEGEKLRPAGIP